METNIKGLWVGCIEISQMPHINENFWSVEFVEDGARWDPQIWLVKEGGRWYLQKRPDLGPFASPVEAIKALIVVMVDPD